MCINVCKWIFADAQEGIECIVKNYTRSGTCVKPDRCEELKKHLFPSGIVLREELNDHTRRCGFEGKLPLVRLLLIP